MRRYPIVVDTQAKPPPAGTHRCKAKPMASAQARGFTVIESMVVLAVVISLMSLGSRYISGNIDHTLNQATANHLKKIDQAANAYVKDHYRKLSSEPSELTIKMLIEAGYLPLNTLESNHHQQGYKIQLVPKKQGKMELLQVALTTQGGQPIPEKAMRKITDLVGGQAGYTSILSPSKVTGAQGSWQMESADLPLKVGHLATVTLVNQQEVIDADSFLRRKKFDGHPEYNKMESDLEIADNKRIFFGEDGFELFNNNIRIKKKMELSESTLTFTDRGGNYITVEGGGNKFFKINNPTHYAELWSDFLKLNTHDRTSSIELNHQHSPFIEVKNSQNHEGGSTKISPTLIEFKRGGFLQTTIGSHGVYTVDLDDMNKFHLTSDSLTSGIYRDGSLGKVVITNPMEMFSKVTNHYIKIPFMEIEDIGENGGNSVGICKPNGREGALFLIGTRHHGIGGIKPRRPKELLICINGKPEPLKSWEG